MRYAEMRKPALPYYGFGKHNNLYLTSLLILSSPCQCQSFRHCLRFRYEFYHNIESNSFQSFAVEDALKAGANGSPPHNLRKSSTFVAIVVCVAAALFIVLFRGLADSRRSLDAANEREQVAKERERMENEKVATV